MKKYLFLLFSLVPLLSFGQTAFPVSQETLSQRLKDESVPTYGLYTGKTGAWTTQSIGGFAVPTGCNLFVESISFSANVLTKLQLTTFNNELLPSGQNNELRQFITTKEVIPYNRYFEEHESIGLSFVDATGGDASTQVYLSASARTVSGDISKDGTPIEVLGTSISSGTGPTYGRNEYVQLLIKYLESKGTRKFRKVLKAKGGWTSGNALAFVNRGNVQRVKGSGGIFIIEQGTNNTTSASYAADLPQIIDQVRAAYPGWIIWILGPTPRQDANEAGVMVGIRNAAASIVAGYNDPKIWYTSNGAAFSNVGDTYYLTNDGTTAGTRVHPNDLGHQAMANTEIAYLEANGNAKLNLLLKNF